MSKQSSKRINSYNARVIRTNLALILVANLFPLLILVYTKKYEHSYLFRTLPELLAFYFLYATSRPKNRISHGTDLKSRGVISLVFDFMYLSVMIRFLAFYSKLAYVLYLLVVVCGWYEFIHRNKKNKKAY